MCTQDLEVTSGDGVKLHAWLLKDPTWHPDWTSKRPIVMFFQVGTRVYASIVRQVGHCLPKRRKQWAVLCAAAMRAFQLVS